MTFRTSAGVRTSKPFFSVVTVRACWYSCLDDVKESYQSFSQTTSHVIIIFVRPEVFQRRATSLNMGVCFIHPRDRVITSGQALIKLGAEREDVWKWRGATRVTNAFNYIEFSLHSKLRLRQYCLPPNPVNWFENDENLDRSSWRLVVDE